MNTPSRLAIAMTLAITHTMSGHANAQQPAATAATAQRVLEQFRTAPDTTIRSYLRAGTASAPVLQSLLERDDLDDGLRKVVQRAHVLCSVDAPVTEGLKLGLASDAATLAVGAAATFTVTLCNVSDRTIEIDAGMSYSGNAFANGSLLERLDADGTALARARYVVGFCGTGAHPLTESIPPLDFRRFAMKVVHGEGPDARAGDITEGAHLHTGYVQLALSAAEADPQPSHFAPLRLRLRHDVRKSESAITTGRRQGSWHHVLVSNVLTLPTETAPQRGAPAEDRAASRPARR